MIQFPQSPRKTQSSAEGRLTWLPKALIGTETPKKSSEQSSLPSAVDARRWLQIGAAILITITFVASATSGFDDVESDSQPVGLQGVLPSEIPEDLSAEAFSILDGNWKDWGQEAAAQVAELYESGNLDAKSQRAKIEKLRSRLRVMRLALADDRYQQIFDSLVSLHGRLLRRVELAEAALNTLQLDPAVAKVAKLNAARKDVEVALSKLDNYLSPLPKGTGWLQYVRVNEIREILNQSGQTDSSAPVLLLVQQRFRNKTKLQQADQRAFLEKEEFRALEESLDQYLQIAHAANKPTDKTELRKQLAELLNAVESFESSSSAVDSKNARKAFARIRELAPDGGDQIGDALRSHYFNYNLRIVASEKLLSKLIGEKRVDNGPVHDFILGAQVRGTQTTNTVVAIDLKASDSGIRFQLVLDGTTQSTTTGTTEQATIFTSGVHKFIAKKEVIFDGDKFATRPATISVSANNHTTGARTSYSRVPIFGSLADGIAVRVARKKRPESEAIARQRVSSRVLPEFNQEVDKSFNDANKELEDKVNRPLRELNLYPSAMSFRSSENEVSIKTRLMTDGELAADTPITKLTTNEGMVLHIHESLLNNALDRLNLAGRTVTEDQVAAEIEESLSQAIGRDLGKSNAKKESDTDDDDPATLIFPDSDPIRIAVTDSGLTLIIRAGLKQDEGEEDIPTQTITVPLTLRIVGDDIVIERGSISVAPVERPKSLARQIVRAGVVRRKIGAALPPRKIDRHLDIEREGQEPIKLSLATIKSLDGWLSIAFE